ncbi:peptide chain release factor N(5)-glutamine methyltransferase [Nocardioides zeae]|uniref:Release factor glutamine methyltransferase n=1 Tax=Nocardioides imazamoxiresistens TaxID=3231893 RepID=A0ABU3Q0R4_9ACTN|nr:peptide chain release factor N(5)-glutamine methyltransferase [Nocardioides zeae]MDT9595100.1 peptide chain release factor N(5)-glutamine methyltransferase [Nocardioides zeae]
MTREVRRVRRVVAEHLAGAGVASPQRDVDELLAHVLGVPLGQVALVDELTPEQADAFHALATRRAAREPLQHLTGTATFRYVDLEVGPGVFVPRPETELLAGWAVERAQEVRDRTGEGAVVLDLCTGSGAIAASVAHEVPSARVHAVELDPAAYDFARRNLAGTGVDLREGDLASAADDLLGGVDVVVCNPPYVPLEAWESVTQEARDHDPHLALFSGDDGLDAIRVLVARAAVLLRPGGHLGFEHADVQGEAAPAVVVADGRWSDVADHRDLAGRARYTTARLAR